MPVRRGRHFLQIPGPTNVPDRVLRAMDMPTIDHRGPEFAELGREVLSGCRTVFQTDGPVVIFPGSGTGACEAALVNTLSPGDRVLIVETGQFATLWRAMAERLGLAVDLLPGDWRHGVDPADVEAPPDRGRRPRLPRGHGRPQRNLHRRDQPRAARFAVRSTGRVIRRCFFVDAVSSLASIDYRHDEWASGRHRRRLAEGADAAAGPRLQRRLGEGARGRQQDRAASPVVLGLAGRCSRPNDDGLLSLHAGDESPLRAARGAATCCRRKASPSSSPPRASRRGDPCSRPRLGPGDPVPPTRRVLEHADRGADARWARRRRASDADPRAVRHVARRRARQVCRARCFASATSATSTT